MVALVSTPRHAYEADEKGRYYRHPITGQELISVTNALAVGFAKFGLPRWYAANAADWALDNLPSVVVRSSTDRAGVREDIVTAADRARDSAADLGTRVHDLAEAHLLGRILPADPDLDAEAGLYVAHYLRFLDDFDVRLDRDVVASEMTVADPSRGYAGTLDLILELAIDGFIEGKVKPVADGEPRRRWLIDIKTSRKRASTQCYPNHALQLAALRHARECWVRTPDGSDVVEPMPRGIAGCAVLNLRTNTYKLIPLPAETPEFKVFLSVLHLARYAKDEWPGDFDHRPVRPDGRFEPKRNTKTSQKGAA